ncbi:hypothetical protein B0H17DRAFT_862322, partial [Mycena rosella]
CPAKAANWFVAAHAAMTKQELGCHFDAAVVAWTRLEDVSRFEKKSGPNKLPTKERPKQVGAWIMLGRGKAGAKTTVGDPGAYTVEWQGWWDSLQPEWRSKGVDRGWATDGCSGRGEDWGPLYCWGVNGMLSLLASLQFWGSAVQ